MTEETKEAERKALVLFATTTLVYAIAVGSMMISDWGAGVLDNRVEWVYWAGTILGAVGVILFAAAIFPARANLARTNGLTRAGLVLFLVAPILCVTAYMVDYWI